MKQRSVMKHQFSEVPRADIPRSSFDRSHGYKTAFNAGDLIPIFVDEALPGDTFNLSMTGFSRLATPIFPIMDNMYMESFFFAVPHRLIWDNWQKFCGEQDDPGDSTDFTVPVISVGGGGGGVGSLSDYMGIPAGVGNFDYSALWVRAYNLIFNEWFRDQNLQNSVTVHTDDGPDPSGSALVRRRGKRHDYFTSCLPFPQKGPSVNLPLGVSAPVTTDASSAADLGVFSTVENDTLDMISSGPKVARGTVGSTVPLVDSLYADLTNATAATINELREAFQIQKLFERDARGGSRYTEIVRAHFGVTSPDARLQRPEFLGGGSSPVEVRQVPQTSETDLSGPDASPQGNLAAYGIASLMGHGFTKSFTEHCVLIGLINVRADLTYQQGLNRMWSRQTRFDYYWPAFSHLGEQEVLNKEIFLQGTSGGADDENVFGFQERYAEYRYKPSVITGIMRSSAPETLDAWHLSQDFPVLPVLNESFIQDDPPIDRVIAVTGEPHFIFDAYFKLRCARPMPLYGVPGMIDHF